MLLGDLTNLIGGVMINLLPPMLLLALYYTSCDVILLYQMYIYRLKPDQETDERVHLLPKRDVSPEELHNQHKRQRFVNFLCTGLVIVTGFVAFIININKPYNGPHEQHSDWKGQAIGWTSALLYTTSRIPQIRKNNVTKCEGLSIPLFCFALSGNISYVLQVIFESTDFNYILINSSWLTGTVGTIVLDLVVLGQYIYYQHWEASRLTSIDRENT